MVKKLKILKILECLMKKVLSYFSNSNKQNAFGWLLAGFELAKYEIDR